MTDAPLHLTQQQYDRLVAELEDRKGPRRAEITKRIESAREEGDLKENGGYHAAKEEQGKNEAKIRELQHKIDHAIIGLPEADEGTVGLGHRVTVKFLAFDDEETFILASRDGVDGSETVYSPTSPLGQAVLGADIGSTVSFTTPAGKTLEVEILSSELA